MGEGGRPFTLCKFRSMRTDAETGTPVWATDKDDRATRVGRFIRLARLDELPQLWNVLRGDMSFVGPRPERPYFVAQLAAAVPFYMARHSVKPGVTGWAQVKYRYGSSIEDATEKLRASRPLLHQASVDSVRPDDRDRYRQGHFVGQGSEMTPAELPGTTRRRAGAGRTDDRAKPVDQVSGDRRRDCARPGHAALQPGAPRQVRVRPVDADRVGHRVLFGAGSRLFGSARQVRRSVPHAARHRCAQRDPEHHFLRLRGVRRRDLPCRDYRPRRLSRSTVSAVAGSRFRPAGSCCS